MSLNTITQRPSESLHIYVSRYSRLHYASTDKTAYENTDPVRIYHFVTSINNTNIADKIATQMWYAPKTLQDAFKGLSLLKLLYSRLKVSPKVMQVSTSASSHHNRLVYIQLILQIVKPDLMPVGSVEDCTTSKRIARLP